MALTIAFKNAVALVSSIERAGGVED
jgi:hypothetical protein